MPPEQRVPSKDVLRRWKEEGLTQAQMAERTLAEYGHRVTRSAIAQALSRYGLSKTYHRYEDTCPWQVNPLHISAAPLRNLRLLGKRLAGHDMTEAEERRLDWFLGNLTEKNLIVGYDPADDGPGFVYINAEYRDHDDQDIPIRRKPLRNMAKTVRRAAATRRKRPS